jgi:hypothetical protein
VGVLVFLQGVELRTAGEVVDEGHAGLPFGGVGHARQHHVDAIGGERVDHLLETGLLPFDLDAQAFGQRIAQVIVEAGQLVGGRVLEIHRRIVRHDRDDDLALGLDAGRQFGGEADAGGHQAGEYCGDYEVLHGRSLMSVLTPLRVGEAGA